jgi:glycosyltransferase involved in cell wall biosynthesis
MRIEILLAACNGADHLEAQLQSLLAQSHTDWIVTASDDGSTDLTPAILQRYAAEDPGRFRIVSAGGGLGALRHFSALFHGASERYIMFCDQDDVWLPRKIEAAAAAMADLEGRFGRDVPALVHSDLRVVGPALEARAGSFWRRRGFEPELMQTLERLLVRNVVTGSTVLVNEPLRRLASPIPESAFMHDWWLALVAAALGRIQAVPEPTVLYRQHGRNVVGARRRTAEDVPGLLLRGGIRRYYQKTQIQAAEFLGRFGERLHPDTRDRVARYAGLLDGGRLPDRLRLVVQGVRDVGLRENLAFVLLG